MKNSKLRRILLLLACAVLLVSLSVSATLAYLTSTTQTVKNTFTVGSVNITLDETNTDKFDQFGSPNEGTARDNGNIYNIVPGTVYDKDPTVTVKAGSEDCYVRMVVKIKNYDKLLDIYAADGNGAVDPKVLFNNTFNSEAWDGTFSYDQTTKEATGYFYYKSGASNIVKKSASDTELPALFTKIKFDGEKVTEENIGNLAAVKIDIVAHAIQADGFGSREAAWEAYDKQKAE